MSIPSLFEISSEIIRQRWYKFSNDILPCNPVYDLLWDSWYKKCNFNKYDYYVCLLRDFLLNDGGGDDGGDTHVFVMWKDGIKTLVIQNLSTAEQRHKIYELCDALGLYHYSTEPPKRQKYLKYVYIYHCAPEKWKWEFTRCGCGNSRDGTQKKMNEFTKTTRRRRYSGED